MSDDELASTSSQTVSVVRAGEPADFTNEKAAVNPLLRLHVLLHGRYRIATMLALLLGICGAIAAYLLTPPKYEIVGYVRVKPYIPKVLHPTDQTGMLPMFDSYVSFQESLLQSQRVMDRAAQNSEWAALHRKTSGGNPDTVNPDNLLVEHEKGTELIMVTVTDRNLNVALAAVKSILKAYMEIREESDNDGGANRLKVLEDVRTGLQNQQSILQEQLRSIANDYGTEDLSPQIQLKTKEVGDIEAELQKIALNLPVAQAAPDQPAAPSPSTQPVQLTRDDVAVFDKQMQDCMSQETQLQLRLAQLRIKLGENSEEVRETLGQIEVLDRHMDDRLSFWQARGLPNGAAPTIHDRSGMSVAELKAQQAYFQDLYTKAHNAQLDLGRKDLQIHKLKDDDARITQRLNDVSAQIEDANVDAMVAGRVSILSEGEKPTTPPKSKQLPMTAAGGIGGACLGVALVALWGFADRRVRSVLQVQQLQPAVRMLGVLPVLPEELSNLEQKQMAAHCVHQIRTLLDTGDHRSGRVLTITSPSAGDGKTSLTLSLGLSFAGAGYRTLLVDCDIVGGGLTGRLNAIAHRGVGTTLYKLGLLTKVQLKEAYRVCVATHRKLPEVLLELGYATEEDIRRADAERDETSVGLLNALDGEPVSTCVTSVLAKGLFILPLGDAAAEHTSQVSPKAFRRLLTEARHIFDVVIVDTGPILGSLEASIVAREADEVVLAVASHGSAPLLKRSISMLQSLGVPIAGLVFNRATPNDVAFARYGSSSSHASVRSVRSRDRAARTGTNLPRLGSLVAAVVNAPVNGDANGTANGRANGTTNTANGAANGTLNGGPMEGNGHDPSH